MANPKIAGIAKKAMMDTVKQMTPQECMAVMPEMMKLMGGKTPPMQKMMGNSASYTDKLSKVAKK